MRLSQPWIERLLRLQEAIADRLRASMKSQSIDQLAAAVRDESGDGDTIFAIDVDAEEAVLAHCEEWGKKASFRVVAEGLPDEGLCFGTGEPTHRVILDPIDGTRGLMYDKRSAWSLAAVAPERGPETRLTDVDTAVMRELPTTRQHIAEVLVGKGALLLRSQEDSSTGMTRVSQPIRPSRATDLRHGFATICNFFQGGKELTARIEEDFMNRALDGWNAAKAECYTDQYISSGGQLAELVLGRDRCVIDIRPLVHRKLGYESTLCARPYDVCTALIAELAGCVVTDPFGGPLDPPLDTTTNVAFAAWANRKLADRFGPMLREALAAHGITDPRG